MTGFGLKAPFSVYNTSTASIDNNTASDPGDRHEPHRARPEGGRGVDGAAQEQQQHAADQGGPEEHRRHRREGELHRAVDEQPGHLQLGRERLDQLQPRLHHQRRTGDLGSSRVFSDPAKSEGPFAGIMAAAAVHGATVTSSNSASAAAERRLHRGDRRATPQDEGEEYTGAGDCTSGNTMSHAVALGLDPKQNSGAQNGLITGRRPLGQALRGRARGRQRHRHERLVRDAPAVLMAWYPGMVGGNALGRLLFGDVAPSGKLPDHLGRER